jgi:hypothetical protein
MIYGVRRISNAFSFIFNFPLSIIRSCLSRLLRFQLIELPLLAVNFRLLRLYPTLHLLVLLLARLHLIADHRAAEKPYGSPDTSARAGTAGGATDDRAQTGSGKSSDGSAFFSGRQRLGAAEEEQSQ